MHRSIPFSPLTSSLSYRSIALRRYRPGVFPLDTTMATLVSKIKNVVSPNHGAEQGAHPPAPLHGRAQTIAATADAYRDEG